jgi:pyruvate/2-oxoacid:ferredoxin oxidoreductase alpha subunit
MILTGNHAVAYGVRSAKAEIIAAYPITPQTQIIEKLAELITKGEMRAKYIRVESEHSAMAACISAEACGARSFTATSSHGLMYMSELVFWAGMGRFPVTMAVVNRTLAPPWSIWNEHTDILTQRDAGWVIMMCDSAQEAYDIAVQAFKIAEDERVLQPVMYGLDAFSLSHTAENVDLLDQKDVDRFLPPIDPSKLAVYMDPDNPVTFGNLLGPDMMMEFRHKVKEGMEAALGVIDEVARDYSRISGRPQSGLLEDYRCGDAEVILISVGASSGDAKDAVDQLRDEGVKAGTVKLTTVRPFPALRLREKLGNTKTIAVVDRDYSYGFGGILAGDIEAGLRRGVTRYIAGIGGRDISVADFRGMMMDALKTSEGGGEKPEVWWGLKEVP